MMAYDVLFMSVVFTSRTGPVILGAGKSCFFSAKPWIVRGLVD